MLSDVDKFNYLSSMLEGSAAETIAWLSITSFNYEEAVAILTEIWKQAVNNKQAHGGSFTTWSSYT